MQIVTQYTTIRRSTNPDGDIHIDIDKLLRVGQDITIRYVDRVDIKDADNGTKTVRALDEDGITLAVVENVVHYSFSKEEIGR